MKTNRHSHPEQQNEASQGPKIPPEIREALQHILNYLWADEENDYLGTSRADRSQHIFVALRKIDNWRSPAHLPPALRHTAWHPRRRESASF